MLGADSTLFLFILNTDHKGDKKNLSLRCKTKHMRHGHSTIRPESTKNNINSPKAVLTGNKKNKEKKVSAHCQIGVVYACECVWHVGDCSISFTCACKHTLN